MKYFQPIVLSAAIILSAGMAEAANSPPAMIVPGQLNVTSTGAATYTIPITAPPGTFGMVPTLSLQYSSSDGDGVEGLGWVLGGLPSISRCPRTIAQDSTHGSVNYDGNDRFCMGAERLVVISGAYGADGSEYRTEVESFTRIIAHGTAGSGPAWFEAHTKSGQIMQLGNTSDSQVLATGISSVRTWAVNRIADTAGNYMTISYNSATSADRTTYGEVYPVEIDYTGNTNAATSPYNSVKFSYSSRSDSVPSYQAGSVVQPTVLMTDIKTYQGASLVTDYQLGYRAGTTVVHSRLTSLTQCDASSNCLPATNFGWQGGTQAQVVSSTTIPTPPTGNGYLAADYNGDGLTDFALIPTGIDLCPPFSIYLGTASSGFSASSLTLPNPAVGYPICGAFPPAQTILTPNAAAAASILVQGNTGPPTYTIQVFVSLLTTSNAINVVQFTLGAYSYAGGSPGAGDFNGDGIPDIFMQTAPNSTFFLGSSGGTFTANSYTGMPWINTLALFGDFDGDGCTDIYAQTIASGGTSAVIYAPYCHPAISTASLPMPANSVATLGDFNGDGKTDVIGLDSGGTLRLWLSTGTGFVMQPGTVPATPDVVGDFNGDGKADFVAGGTLYLSTGTGFTAALDGIGNPITLPSGYLSDWNSDGTADLLVPNTTWSIAGLAYVPELMTSISNGIGALTTISYDRLNKNGSLYQKCATSGVYNCSDVYPTQSLDGPIYVVSEIDSSNGLGTCPVNCYRTTYAYSMAKTDLQGRGFLGFAQIVVTDPQTNVVQTSNYSQTFPYIGMVTSQTRVHGTTTLNTVTNTLNNNSGCGITPAASGVYAVCTTQTVEANNDLNGSAFPTVTTNYTYDNYANTLTNNVSKSDGSYKNTTNTFNNDTTNWFLGRLATMSVASHVGSSTLTRASSFSYDTTTGLLAQEVLEPGVSTCNSGASSCTLTTTYTLDLFGHRKIATVSGTGITTRSSSAVYDSLGQFQTQTINALSQTEGWAYDPRFGTPTSHTDTNLITTSWSYDTFGRMAQEARPDGTLTKSSYGYCSSGCPSYGAFSVQSEAFASGGVVQIGAISTAYYDSLSRSIASDKQGFNGSTARVATQYDANERVSQVSRSYFTAFGIPRFTVFAYDDLGRPTQATFPDSSHTTYGYNALVTTVTNNLSQITTTTLNAQGLKASVQDALSHTTSYVYDAFGNPLTVTDPSSNVTTNTFDVRGNKVSSADPDMGTWVYTYDVLGELTNQTDAKSQGTTLTYDLLGRVLTKSEVSQYNNWTYGTSSSAHNVGKIIEAKACTSSACTTVNSDRSFTFDSLARSNTVVLTIGGVAYTYNEAYNALNGSLSHVGYPSGFSANYTYNAYGYVTYLADDGGSPVWSANARDAEMHLTSQTQGNGFVMAQTFDPNTGLIQTQSAGVSGAVASFAYGFDTIGNLTYRTDNNGSYTERFCYDSLNRLINSNIGSLCTGGKAISFDNSGNISSKSDAGTYSYPSTGAALPHAVSSITGTVNGMTNPKYSYDANGNMTCVSTGTSCTGTIGRQLSVTSFNMAITLTEGSTSTTLKYDDQHARLTQSVTVAGTTTTTTYLNDPISGAMSQFVQVGATTPKWVDYLQVDGLIVAQRTAVYQVGALWGSGNWGVFAWATAATTYNWGGFNWGSGIWSGPLVTWAYFSLDHLASVSVISDQGGNVVQRLSYDPWGRQRNPNGTDAACGSITSSTTRGFTNQEQLSAECLVNLNARIYDPSIGRFMAADSIIPNPSDGQSFNRFSYVSNNPLSFADPTGHDDSVTVTGTRIHGPIVPLGSGGEEFTVTDLSDLNVFFASFQFGDRGSVQDRYSQAQAQTSVRFAPSLAPAYNPRTLGRQTSTDMGAVGLASLPGSLLDGATSLAAQAIEPETVVVTADNIKISWSLYNFSVTAGVQLVNGPQGTPHRYNFSVPLCLGCSTADALNAVRSASAPGAPYAEEGTHRRILTGGNPINQTVNSTNDTIENDTLPGHRYYPGSVVLSISQDESGVVSENILGTGTGAHAEENQILGPAIFFGLSLEAYARLNPTFGSYAGP